MRYAFIMTGMFGKTILVALLGISFLLIFVVISENSHDSFLSSIEKEYFVLEDFNNGVTANAWGLFDVGTGKVLYGENIDDVLPIASVTKLFSARTAYLQQNAGESVEVSWEILLTEGRAGKLKYGEEFTREELLFPLLLESSNDAAEAIARFENRDEYISDMNSFVKEIGMSKTQFVDPSGLGQGNVSTVSELAYFTSDTIKNNQHIFDITRLEKYIGKNHTWWNSSPAIEFAGYVGGKHGYTDEAGGTIIALFNIELQNNITRKIGIILLGSKNISKDVRVLHEYVQKHIVYK